MSVRIFQLAKELEMSSKDLIAFLRTQGIKVISHMSTIQDPVAQILRDRYRPKLSKEKEKAIRDKAALEKAAQTKGKAVTNGGAAAQAPAADQKDGPGLGKPLGRPVATDPNRYGPLVALPPRPGAATPAKAETPGTRTAERPKVEGGTERDRKAKEKGEREKETPTRKRYFFTPDDSYDGPRFGTSWKKIAPKHKKKTEGGDVATAAPPEKPSRVEIALPVTVKALSSLIGVKAASILKILMQHGQSVHINHFLDEDMVTTVAIELGVDVAFKQKTADLEDAVRKTEDYESQPEDMVPRAPVVTFLGHVDHGKTSLLDKIRETSVTLREAGGITQHLGAYRVDRGKVHVVFIDTPGHQAFTEMRARGADVTDVAVLVVAADDGVMPQTEEALNHARDAKVPIVVAINKVDKPSANVLRTKQQLAALGLQPVEWGGDTEFVEVSAMTSQGIDTLLETLSLTSEILELRANSKRPAIGVVLEAEASTNRGVIATVLVKEGILRQGDYVLCGPAHGRIKGMWLNGTEPVKEAPPSTPVKVTGLNLVPQAGDRLYVFKDAQQARELADDRLRKSREKDRAERDKVTRDNIFDTLKREALEEVRLIVKTDVRGSLEALRSEIESLSTPEVKVKILHGGVGAINQADVALATASQPQAAVIGFNVSADERARSLADERKVDIRVYQVIYKATDDVRALMQARLAPQIHEEVHGHAEIRQIFKASKVGNIAGCMVIDGFMNRNDRIRILRNGRIVHTGTLNTLKRFKDDAREVKEGFECGLTIANYNDIQAGDIIEAFAVVEKARQL